MTNTPISNIEFTPEEYIVLTEDAEVNAIQELEKYADEEVKKEETKYPDLIKVTENMGVEFYVNSTTFDAVIIHNGVQYKPTKAQLEKLNKSLKEIKSLQKVVTSASFGMNDYRMGDVVLFYGPTGTGKTHQVLEWIKLNKLPHDMITVSDGFEDLDFLTYIMPSQKGIQYKEKNVVSLLRKAADGEKVAILIDEVNRGSRSFMNMLLKMLDPVTGSYEINNFIKDEIIKIPKDNIIFFCTANLGGGYSGTNEIDEALFDRFNKISFVDYNKDFEAQLYKEFKGFESEVQTMVEYIRELYKDSAIQRPISSRTIKAWAETFINSPMTKEALFVSFNQSVMFRLCGIDSYGNPNEQDQGVIAAKFKELGII